MKSLSVKWGIIITLLFVATTITAQTKSEPSARKRPVATLYNGKTFFGIPIFAPLDEICAQLKKMGSLMDSPDIEDTYYWVENAKYRGNVISNVEVVVTTENEEIRSMCADWKIVKTQAEIDKKTQELVKMVSKYVTLEKDTAGAFKGSLTNADGETHIVKIIKGEQSVSLLIINPNYAFLYGVD